MKNSAYTNPAPPSLSVEKCERAAEIHLVECLHVWGKEKLLLISKQGTKLSLLFVSKFITISEMRISVYKNLTCSSVFLVVNSPAHFRYLRLLKKLGNCLFAPRSK